MTTPIKINADPSTSDLNRFNEDSTMGVYRIGRALNRERDTQRVLSAPLNSSPTPTALLDRVDIAKIVSLTNENLSGVKLELFESGLDTDKVKIYIAKENDNAIARDFSKVRQGISVRSTFDTHADMLPYLSVGNNQPYPANIHQRFFPSFDEDFFGVKEILDRKAFVPYEDITELNPSFLSASVYLQISNPYSSKIYPKYSGSHYSSPYQMNGTIEPFDISRIRHRLTLIDQVSSFASRGYFYGISATIMGSERENAGSGKSYRASSGASFINDKYVNEINSNDDVEAFNDSIVIERLGLDNLATINSLEDDSAYRFKYFDDTIDYLSSISSYNHLDNKTSSNSFLSGSMRSISEIGTRYKSAKAGFVYESTTLGNTTLGTDSIAFGGLKRE